MSELDDIVETREEQLRTGNALALIDFWLSLPKQINATQLLFELIALDMEFAWKSGSPGDRKRIRSVADVVRLFPEVEDGQLLQRLTIEEYRVRWRFGDRPDRATFLQEANCTSPALADELAKVDQQLKQEFGSATATRAGHIAIHDQPRLAFDPRAPLSSADYLVQRFIGAGSLGRVYCARQHSLQRSVALKFLRKHFLRSTAAVDRFVQEARLAGGLRHPGIIAIHGLGRTPAGSYFIAMDLVAGQPLSPIDSTAPLQLRDLLDAIAQAAEAMAYAHAAGVIHCDLKPENILRTADGRVTLTDFGLARQLVDEQALALRGEGTPVCIAPEQIDGCWGAIGPATDVFNLMATLYLLLTGRSPHAGTTAAGMFASAVSGVAITPLRNLRPDLPAALDALCAAGLQKHVSDRVAGMRELAAALRILVAELTE